MYEERERERESCFWQGKDEMATTGHLSFTESEIKLFSTRIENGYDLKTDERYNAWLNTMCQGGIIADGVSVAN